MGVYIIQWEGLPYVKIGKADNLTMRLASFATGSPVPIVVRAWMPDASDDTEGEMHCQWAALRHHGEWFKPDDTMTAWIDSLPHCQDYGTAVKPVRGRLGKAITLQRAMDLLAEARNDHQQKVRRMRLEDDQWDGLVREAAEA